MKKVFLFAVAAAALVACSNEELSTPENNLATSEAPVTFDVYTQRAMTRGGGQTGDLTNANIGTNGFGVFAYYTAGEQYDTKATPNFMYNQQVTCSGTATVGTKWTYEPVKYWPNEFGAKAISDEVDYLTFFAYAPYTPVEPTTGNIIPLAGKDVKKEQTLNIISVNKNTASGDPIIKYVVDTDPATSVDLLWGVAAEDADKVYTAIDKPNQNANVEVKAGLPFLSLVKPNNPQSDRLMFNLKHALAKVKVTIDYIADEFTPAESYNLSGGAQPQTIDASKTRIFVRSFKMSGFATKGALNLNNTTPGEPLWKDFDGIKDLAFDEVTFQDGRKDGKEGETNGAQNNETPQGLNEKIIENYAQVTNDVFPAEKNSGVTKDPLLLFGGDEQQNGGFFYVIPRNEEGGKVDITIAYDVETIDKNLAGKLSDGETHGISIENIIQKPDIFGGMDFRAGYQYEINIHIGMTSVKVEATVTDWKDNGKTDVELPDNQEPYNDYFWTIGDGNPFSDATITRYTDEPTSITMAEDRIFVVKDEGGFNAAYAAGPLQRYYTWLDQNYPIPSTNPSSYNKITVDWDDLDPRHHSWTSWLANPAHNNTGMVVFDLAYSPAFVGKMTVEYDGAEASGFAGGFTVDQARVDDGRTYVICDYTELATGLDALSTDAKKIKVTLERSNVHKWSYTTGAEVTNP